MNQENRDSIKSVILKIVGYSFMSGAEIEDSVRKYIGVKASNVSRRCRELANEGKLDRWLFRGHVYYRANVNQV